MSSNKETPLVTSPFTSKAQFSTSGSTVGISPLGTSNNHSLGSAYQLYSSPKHSSPRENTSPSSSFAHRRNSPPSNESFHRVAHSQHLVPELEVYSKGSTIPKSKHIESLEVPVATTTTREPRTLLTTGQSQHVGRNQALRERERQQWSLRQKALQDQLADVQDECRRLRDACAEVEQRSSRRVESLAQDRPLSSQSWRGSSFQYSAPSRKIHSSSIYRDGPASLNAMGNSKNTNSLSGSLRSSLSTSSTNLSGPRPTQDHLFNSSSRGRSNATQNLSSAYSSIYSAEGEGRGHWAELESARLRNKKLEREASALEQRLLEKNRTMDRLSEEMAQLKTLLAQEKSAHVLTVHETQEKAAKEVGRVKVLHAEQISELEAQVKQLRLQKREAEEESTSHQASLTASKKEVKSLSSQLHALLAQLDKERLSHRESMEKLQEEAESGSKKVTELHQQLSRCQQELSQCLAQVEGMDEDHEKEVVSLRHQVTTLSSQVEKCRAQLAEAGHALHRLQSQADSTHQLLAQSQHEWEKKEKQLQEQLSASESSRHSLLRKLEDANQQLVDQSQRLAGLQESSLAARQLEGEVEQLRHSLSHSQKQQNEQQRALERAEKDSERRQEEARQLRARLEESSHQLGEMQKRSEEWRGERERLSSRAKEIQAELDQQRKEEERLRRALQEARSDGKARNSEVESTLAQMQQELATRAQQVMELDGLLRSHQADTTARRLQLERNLAQRQADLRSRTQELEELTRKHAQTKQLVSDLQKQLEGKENAETAGQKAIMEADMAALKNRVAQLEEELRETEREKSRASEQSGRLTSENQLLRDQHSKQLQRSQESHANLVAARDQQIAALRQQIKQLQEHETHRQEEVARCRAQVVSLSAELSVERQMVNETRLQLARVRAATPLPATPLASLIPNAASNNHRPPSRQSATDSASEVEFAQLPWKPTEHHNGGSLPSSSGQGNIIHI